MRPGPTVLGMVDNVDESVSNEDRRRLVSLLTVFSSAFSQDENDLGWTDSVRYRRQQTGASTVTETPIRALGRYSATCFQYASARRDSTGQKSVGLQYCASEEKGRLSKVLRRLPSTQLSY